MSKQTLGFRGFELLGAFVINNKVFLKFFPTSFSVSAIGCNIKIAFGQLNAYWRFRPVKRKKGGWLSLGSEVSVLLTGEMDKMSEEDSKKVSVLVHKIFKITQKYQPMDVWQKPINKRTLAKRLKDGS